MFLLLNILFILLQQNAFTDEKHQTCIITKCTLSHLFLIKVAIFRDIHLSIRFLTAVAAFQKSNAIPLRFSIDLFLNFLLSWLFVFLPSTFFFDVLFSFSPVVSNQ